MDVKQLADLVQRMRTHQQQFFRTRDASLVPVCRDLERRVDQAVAALLRPPARPVPDLFEPMYGGEG